MKAVAVLFDSRFRRKGTVHFRQSLKTLTIQVETEGGVGLKKGLHGFHIHETGDLTEGCKTLCAHYNPDGVKHGGPHSRVRHRGDLGNVRADNKGRVKQTLSVPRSRLELSEIIGRSVIIHADSDDLGRGVDEESTRTGNAGKRVLCGVIGLASVCT